MSDFYRRLDQRMIEERTARIFRDRPENLHDYQGCANDSTKAEELVRKVWPCVFMHKDSYGFYFLLYGTAMTLRGGNSASTDAAHVIKLAADFTRAHLEKVLQKREEINCVRLWTSFAGGEEEREIGLRILSMLEAQLAELESGLTDWAKKHVEEIPGAKS